MYNVLLIEDSPDFQILVTRALGSQFKVAVAGSLKEARENLAKKMFDLILLDVELPDGNGFEFCSELQTQPEWQVIPVVFLTGHGDHQKKTLGWSLGADDYIIKPFHIAEFQMRVLTRIRKHLQRQEQSEQLQWKCFHVNLTFHEAKIVQNGTEKRLNLTPHEFKILTFFLKNKDRVLSRAQVMKAVWGDDVFITERTVDKHISSLRQKLEDAREYIKTVSGIGYRFGAAA